jgi:two-component SAPR family response regulator
MFPEIKVLYISGYAGDMLVSHGVNAHTAYLQKPFLPQALIEKVADLLLPVRPLPP